MRFPKDVHVLDTPTADLPQLICSWIWYHCEKPDPESESQLARETLGYTYQHAEKMRAAISYHYTYVKKLGNGPYGQNTQGSYSGNPNNSDTVSRYMRSLRRRKV